MDGKMGQEQLLFNLLHPDYENLPQEAKEALEYERQHMSSNLNEIQGARLKYIINDPKMTSQEALRMAVDQTLESAIFHELFPEYDSLTTEEVYSTSLDDERDFVRRHLSEIGKLQYQYQRNGQTPQEALQNAYNYSRAQSIFRELHPEYDSLTPDKKLELMEEHDFIFEHVTEIRKVRAACIMDDPELSLGRERELLRMSVDQVMASDNNKKM